MQKFMNQPWCTIFMLVSLTNRKPVVLDLSPFSNIRFDFRFTVKLGLDRGVVYIGIYICII